MSIQSNINQGINQAALLAQLSPAVQELGEQARDESKLKGIEKKLDAFRENPTSKQYTDETVASGAVLPSERDVAQFNQLRAAHEQIAGRLASKGTPIDKFYGEAITEKEMGLIQKKADDQRKKVEAMKEQKKAEAEAIKAARSKQIRDLIMNPNLEVK